jgi:hypothetical protein
MLDVALCEKLAAEYNDTLVSDLDSQAFEVCLPPLAEALARDTAGALDFLRGLPMEQFTQLARLAYDLVEVCTGNKAAYADGLYALAKERGIEENTLLLARSTRDYFAQ